MHFSNDVLANTLTFIVPSRGQNLLPLTRYRPQPILPFGAQRRVIDFVISNCWNSGLRRAFVLPPEQSNVVHQHIRCFDWDGNLMVLHPDLDGRCAGPTDALLLNVSLMRVERPECVLVLTTDQMYKMTYEALLRNHRNNGSRVTVAQRDGREIGAYVFNGELLRQVLLWDSLANGTHEINLATICRAVAARDIHMFDVTPSRGTHWGRVDNIDNYYSAQLRFAAATSNTRGVISPFAEIDATASVENSIVLKGVQIGSGCHIRKAIIEEDIRIPDRTSIGFNLEEDRRRFVVSEGGVIIVDRHSVNRIQNTPHGPRLALARAA